ncbi:hypothetical protein GCWU000282_02725 [Catonella morbi ATCC 51271]|uniref:Uncharacterized protein n=1 Tax=Catonella morbi ATCC 51271 TaxID=592026 RepID=V2Y1F9_9FIRM|nr:hypothetical protein GCWU000282_02725 [Catonella morbi ATCC 51271]
MNWSNSTTISPPFILYFTNSNYSIERWILARVVILLTFV